MSYLKILNLQFNKYFLTTSLEENTIYGIYCIDSLIREDFLKILAGINHNNNSIFMIDEDKEENIFDNENYFKNRIYIDFSHRYLKTLNVNTISEMFKTRFNKEFDMSKYKEFVSFTNIRNEVLLSNEYQFTDLGVNLASFCLFKGLKYKYNIINNPVINIKNSDMKKRIYGNICLKELNPIIGFDNLRDCKEYCDKLIVFGDYQNLVVVDVKNDNFLISTDNIIIRNKLFNLNNEIISINNYTKEELKYLSKNKVKYKIITFNEVIKLLGGNDEK